MLNDVAIKYYLPETFTPDNDNILYEKPSEYNSCNEKSVVPISEESVSWDHFICDKPYSPHIITSDMIPMVFNN